MFDKTMLEEIVKAIEDDVTQVDTLLANSVREYTSELDKVMLDVQLNILTVECPALVTIEKYFLELTNALYFVSEKTEQLGLYDSISKLKAQEKYNTVYLAHQSIGASGEGKKPTVKELEAKSEIESIQNMVISDLYNRAYKIVKNKVSAAESMVSTLSKLYSHRMQEAEFTGKQLGRTLLNESVSAQVERNDVF